MGPSPSTNGVHSDPTPSQAQSSWVPVNEQPAFKPRRLKLICIGAGFSGLLLAYKHKYEKGLKEFIDPTIYEKNHDVGGTWLENRYPGAACDVPAHIYTFPFEPNPDWSSFYAEGPEIWEYIKRTTVSAWDQPSGKWKLKIERQGEAIENECDILVNGSGILNKWQWPKIAGIDTYQGKLIHSAHWDQNLDWKGKRVAIIGNGSSAIQILPRMQKDAAHITTYIRSPTWVTSNFLSHLTKAGGNFQYEEEEKRKFRENPEEFLEYRKLLEHHLNMFFVTLLKDSPQQAEAYKIFKQQMEQRLENDELLCSRLIPSWHNNVEIIFDELETFTTSGIKTKANEQVFDIVICATGFDVSFSPYWELTGVDGISLADQWKDTPESYLGICAANMPNYFIFNGPNCPVSHGSLLAVMDSIADYILNWCKKIATQDIKSVLVKPDVVMEYNAYSQEFLKRTVWTSGCRSWYKNGKDEGRVTAMYPGSVLHYKEMLESFRTEDFNYEYGSPNRFRFMGNGFTVHETNGGDLGYYLKHQSSA